MWSDNSCSSRVLLMGAFLATGALSLGAKPGAPFVVDHVEAPAEIGLGTMAINIWVRLGAAHEGANVGGCSLVLAATKATKEARLEMRAVDGSFGSVIETAVASIDTYAWVLEEPHPYEIRARSSTGVEDVVARGVVRVRGRLAARDLLLFDNLGSATPMLGTGAGGFMEGEPVAIGVPSGRPRLVDWNKDGRSDLIVASNTGEVLVLESHGDGTFDPTETIVCSSHPVDVAAADLDGDRQLDLVVVTEMRGLEIHLSGDGDNEAAQISSVVGGAEYVEALDFEGDGKIEIAVALLGVNESEIQLWTRSGKELQWEPSLRLPAPEGGRGRVQSLMRHRVKGSKRDQLLVGTTAALHGTLESWGVSADTGTRPGIACLGVTRFAGSLLGLAAGRVAGRDGDSILAAVGQERGATLLEIREGAPPRRMGTLNAAPTAIVLTDLDADGDDDLVTAGDDLRLWMNVRGEHFLEAGESPYLLETPAVSLVAGDLDERQP